MSGQHRRTYRLPHGFRATFTTAGQYGFAVDWHPAVPRIESNRAARRFFAAYTRARADFLKDVATMLGGDVIVADVGDFAGITTIEPGAVH